MIYCSSIFVIILSASGFVYAQNVMGGDFGKGIDMNTQAYGIISEIPMASPNLEGSAFLYDLWLPSKLDFGANGTAEGLYIRYDLLNSIFEIRLNDKIKAIDGSYVKKFAVTDTSGTVHHYVNCNPYKNDLTPLVGFFEILDSGKYQLFLKTDVVIIKSNYIQALDLGEKNDQISKKQSYFIAESNKAYKVIYSKKKFASMFPGKPDLFSYLKKSGINLHHADDLYKVVDYMNDNP